MKTGFPGTVTEPLVPPPLSPPTHGVCGGAGDEGDAQGLGRRRGAERGGGGLGRVEVGGGRRKEAGSQDAPSLPRGLTPPPPDGATEGPPWGRGAGMIPTLETPLRW